MALQTVPGGFFWPPPFASLITGAPTLGGVTGSLMDAAAEKVAQIIRVPRSGVLNRIGYLVGSVANNPDNGLRFSFQTVDPATGFADGVQDQFRTDAGPFTANTWRTTGLMTSDGTDGGVKRTVTKGERLAIVVAFESFVAADSISIGITNVDSGVYASADQYSSQFIAAWAFAATQMWSVALEYETDGYVPINDLIYPMVSIASPSIDTGTTPDEIGFRFQLPMRAQCDGCWLRFDYDGDVDIVLYDSDGTTVLRSMTLTALGRSLTAGQNQCGVWDPVTLDANTTYRITMKPTTLTNVVIYTFLANGVNEMAGAPGGAQFYRAHRTDAGAWTDTTTERPFGGVHLSAVDDGAAGGTFSFNTVCPMIVPPRSVAGY